MSVPSPIPLDAFERAIESDPDVLGAFYYGSLGRGAATRYSDVDVFLWLADGVMARLDSKLLSLLRLFGEIRWLEPGNATAYVGPGWIQIDIEYGRREELKPSYRYAGALVIKDADGVMARMAAECLPEQIVETVESASEAVHNALSEIIFHHRHNARGSHWSAVGGIGYGRTLAYELLGRLRGRRTYGYRYAEDLLSPEEEALLAATLPREATRDECRRALGALWEWTRHVWREAERIVGQPLAIDLDEASFLAYVDRMYQ